MALGKSLQVWAFSGHDHRPPEPACAPALTSGSSPMRSYQKCPSTQGAHCDMAVALE